MNKKWSLYWARELLEIGLGVTCGPRFEDACSKIHFIERNTNQYPRNYFALQAENQTQVFVTILSSTAGTEMFSVDLELIR